MDEYIGIVKLFAGLYAPQNWAFCNGQLLNIKTNAPLYAIIGNSYGGDGITTFALPDMRSRVPVGAGFGNNLQPIQVAQRGGAISTDLNTAQMPEHTHTESVSSKDAVLTTALTNSSIAAPTTSVEAPRATYGFISGNPDTMLNPRTVSSIGGSQPHNNMQPYVGINYIICISGIYPQRN
ncbi:MAG: Tail Collar domain protein [Crocinitomicaceae bacterium]|nr:Tail Collar domain protein [Crocinitomicaceae bacterium]